VHLFRGPETSLKIIAQVSAPSFTASSTNSSDRFPTAALDHRPLKNIVKGYLDRGPPNLKRISIVGFFVPPVSRSYDLSRIPSLLCQKTNWSLSAMKPAATPAKARITRTPRCASRMCQASSIGQ